ncbi:LolA family protein [Brevibacillus laterosporus]|uniref:LolA family protein n=1 Tax=Brevibacillus laterosporus TaxID=1465 RepID=UPI001443ED3F|nr:hypothetical protein [Brevibacillus laterosporus]NKQ19171.1 hypothetical protein [Brevibacillus laterosporus]WNX32753.1 hypothetical protein RWW94_08160 [Brevibacillus laterosporus]
MKKQTLIVVSTLAVMLSAISPFSPVLADRVNAAASKNQQTLTLDQVIAEMNKKTPISTYTEATFTTQNRLIENSPRTATTNYKWWDNTINNEMRIETTKDGRTSFYVSKGGTSTSYKEESMEGNKQAVISSTGVKAAVDNKINNTKQELKKLKKDILSDAKVTFHIVEETLLNRDVYHISKKQEKVRNNQSNVTYNELWIDKKTGLKLKSISNANDKQISEYTVTKVDFHPQFNEKDFTLDLPKDVKIIEN